jgi:hypothetical protein
MTAPQSGLSSKNLSPGILDVADAKVARLKGGSGEVVQGDTVPLVATAYFQYKGTNPTTWGNLTVTPGETLFYIDDSGEVRSHKLPIDQDVVTTFLDAHYNFDFSIKTAMGRPLSGVPDSILQTTSRKWVRVLDTAGVQSDLLEIDIRVEPASSVRVELGKPQEVLMRIADAVGQLVLDVEGLVKDVHKVPGLVKSVLGDAQTGAQSLISDAEGRASAWGEKLKEDLRGRIDEAGAAATAAFKEAGQEAIAQQRQTPAAVAAQFKSDWSAPYIELRDKVDALQATGKTLTETGAAVLKRLEWLERLEATAAALTNIDTLQLASIASNLEAIKIYLEKNDRSRGGHKT